MDKLQWFKFSPSDWFMGKITRCDEVTQLRFLRLCCLYWNKETNLSIEDAKIEVDDDVYSTLLSKKIIKESDDNISIEFLDLQFDKILETSRQASEAGKASAEKRRKIAERPFNDRSTTVQRNPTDKIREEEIREDKKKRFSIFWDKYPNKIGKKKTEDKFMRLPIETMDVINTTIDRFISYKPFDNYSHPNPETYINNERWNDVLTPKSNKSKPKVSF